MEELFENSVGSKKLEIRSPLADRMRPTKIEEIVGQQHLLGENAPLRMMYESGDYTSIIFWGPPGVGKTTIAYVLANREDFRFVKISAVESGVKELREIISSAEMNLRKNIKTILFIDEIHRFNKAQQDALLFAVEKGIIILMGATTENPSFEVNSALLSRCQIYRLYPLTDSEIRQILERAIAQDEVLKNYKIEIEDWDFVYNISGGDSRVALNTLEIAVKLAGKRGDLVKIDRKLLEKAIQQKIALYDKKGESHYDTISAFIKSLRGSDPDAALVWLAKMLEAGEDPRFIARRMVIFASEDVGNADPYAITLAVSVFQAVEMVGLPEAQINLAQGATYLASCPKSNASYMGLINAVNFVKQHSPLIVPLHLRNAPTKYMKQEGYGVNYKYPHDYPNHFVKENYFPEGFKPICFYKPTNIARESKLYEWLKKLWEKRYED